MMPIQKVQAVIYDVKENVPYVLVMHRVLHWSGWELPKGTIEGDESPEETICREIREETQLTRFRVMKKLGKSFAFAVKGREVRIVEVFLIKTDMNEAVKVSQPVQEHDAYRWVTLEEAEKLLTHENAKSLIKGLGRNLFK